MVQSSGICPVQKSGTRQLAANTSYADFPRLASLLAKDGFLPRQLTSQGGRLVFSNGILGLTVTACLLIFIFGGDTHHLIPLYAIGVFLSFTLSQTGMVIHHIRTKQTGWVRSMTFNLMGALTTFLVLIVIASTKFLSGAWIVIVLIPLFVILFKQIRAHYVTTARMLTSMSELDRKPITGTLNTAIIPISGLHPGVIKSIRYAMSISQDVRVCYVDLGEAQTQGFRRQWLNAKLDVPLTILKSPYRSVIQPILDYVDLIKGENPDQIITVIVPEFITLRWYHNFLHNQTAILLYAALRGMRGLVVTSVLYHLGK